MFSVPHRIATVADYLNLYEVNSQWRFILPTTRLASHCPPVQSENPSQLKPEPKIASFRRKCTYLESAAASSGGCASRLHQACIWRHFYPHQRTLHLGGRKRAACDSGLPRAMSMRNSCRAESAPSSGGISPLKTFSEINRRFIFFSSPSSAGIGPLSSLLLSSISEMLLSSPNWGGIQPVVRD